MGQIIIGIDPDVDRSGWARIDGGNAATLTLESLDFGTLAIRLLALRAEATKAGAGVTVAVEAGWLNKGNWHVRWHDTTGLACAKGYNVGRNHEAGRKIVELARALGFKVEERRPLRKLWRGAGKKITAAEFKAVTGYAPRSTQDARDAGLIAWTEAGLPLRVPTAMATAKGRPPKRPGRGS